MVSKPTAALTLHDRLSRLTIKQAERMLGKRGPKLLAEGGKYSIDPSSQVYQAGDLFRLRLPSEGRWPIVVTLTMRSNTPGRILINCTNCHETCRHMGAALSLILEEKVALGFAVPPVESAPTEKPLTPEQLVERAMEERRERAEKERMQLRSLNPSRPWTDYLVTSRLSGKTYRVALRGVEPGASYCSCPDFRKNTLGTCKHILHTLGKIKRKFSETQLRARYRQTQLAIHLRYGSSLELRLLKPDEVSPAVAEIIQPLTDGPIAELPLLMKSLAALERLGEDVLVYPDAEEYIQQRLYQQRIGGLVAEIRRDPRNHPLRKTLLKVDLLPYQLDGIAFAVGAGRAILADEMGLGKTIQAIGVAEMLSREAGIRKVLVVTPASLKTQWRLEIQRFCDHEVQLVSGGAGQRAEQYRNDCFYTVCNYEQVIRDIASIERVNWDLIVLDEGQRIKNWETKTSSVIKSLKSTFALVLSGTPLENRLDELYSVVEFIDDRRLGPAFRFFPQHQLRDEDGALVGYRNLGELRDKLKPILLRRTRDMVMSDLPERTDQLVRIPATAEQGEIHNANMRVVRALLKKPYLNEMDLLRLRKHLLMCRMAADSTTLVDKQSPGYSSKLETLAELFDQLFVESGRKVVLFSEWTSMLDLIEPLIKERGIGFERLDGSVPQRDRAARVDRFMNAPDCRLFITTNAGSTGLNLQAANTVINVDLPWNPAVLEQRIARAYRMGQQRPVQVFVLITEGTIEESLLGTLSTKRELALAALDVESDVDLLTLPNASAELKQKLEVLIGARADGEVDGSVKREAEDQQERIDSGGSGSARPADSLDQFAAVGGALLGAAAQLLGQLLPGAASAVASAAASSASGDNAPGTATSGESPATGAATPASANELIAAATSKLRDSIKRTSDGRPQLTLTLPDDRSLSQVATALAGVLQALGVKL